MQWLKSSSVTLHPTASYRTATTPAPRKRFRFARDPGSQPIRSGSVCGRTALHGVPANASAVVGAFRVSPATLAGGAQAHRLETSAARAVRTAARLTSVEPLRDRVDHVPVFGRQHDRRVGQGG